MANQAPPPLVFFDDNADLSGIPYPDDWTSRRARDVAIAVLAFLDMPGLLPTDVDAVWAVFDEMRQHEITRAIGEDPKLLLSPMMLQAVLWPTDSLDPLADWLDTRVIPGIRARGRLLLIGASYEALGRLHRWSLGWPGLRALVYDALGADEPAATALLVDGDAATPQRVETLIVRYNGNLKADAYAPLVRAIERGRPAGVIRAMFLGIGPLASLSFLYKTVWTAIARNGSSSLPWLEAVVSAAAAAFALDQPPTAAMTTTVEGQDKLKNVVYAVETAIVAQNARLLNVIFGGGLAAKWVDAAAGTNEGRLAILAVHKSMHPHALFLFHSASEAMTAEQVLFAIELAAGKENVINVQSNLSDSDTALALGMLRHVFASSPRHRGLGSLAVVQTAATLLNRPRSSSSSSSNRSDRAVVLRRVEALIAEFGARLVRDDVAVNLGTLRVISSLAREPTAVQTVLTLYAVLGSPPTLRVGLFYVAALHGNVELLGALEQAGVVRFGPDLNAGPVRAAEYAKLISNEGGLSTDPADPTDASLSFVPTLFEEAATVVPDGRLVVLFQFLLERHGPTTVPDAFSVLEALLLYRKPRAFALFLSGRGLARADLTQLLRTAVLVAATPTPPPRTRDEWLEPRGKQNSIRLLVVAGADANDATARGIAERARRLGNSTLWTAMTTASRSGE